MSECELQVKGYMQQTKRSTYQYLPSAALYSAVILSLCLFIFTGFIYQDLNNKIALQRDQHAHEIRRLKRQLDLANFITTVPPLPDAESQLSLWPDYQDQQVDDVSSYRSFGFEGFSSIIAGTTYVRWGRISCPQMSALVYSGYIGGPISSRYNKGGADMLCIPNHDEDITGATLQTSEQITPNNTNTLLAVARFDVKDRRLSQNRQITCALCLIQKKAQIMIPAGKYCPSDWIKEYDGWLMTASGSKRSKAIANHICMDRATAVGDPLNNNMPSLELSHVQQGSCSTAPKANSCKSFVNLRNVPCVVCSIS